MSTTTPKKNLVSVICRTVGRPELQDAIDSVAVQSYQNLELIIVDASGTISSEEALNLPSNLKARIVRNGKPLLRAAAANAGLDAAKGDWIVFLDEDDWIAENHIEILVNSLLGQRKYLAAYSNTQKADKDRNLLETVFQEKYNPQLLMRDNHIPIHSMLFSRSLLSNGCKFDEQLDIYEDWDFWLQINRYTDFLHLDTVTAFYREGGDSGTALNSNNSKFLRGHPACEARSKIYKKWMNIWNGHELNSFLGYLENNSELDELSKALAEEHKANIYHQDQLKQRLEMLADLHKSLSSSINERNQLSRTISKLQSKIESVQSNLNESQACVEDLENRISDSKRLAKNLQQQIQDLKEAHRLIENSIFWRVTYPFRKLRDAIRIISKKDAQANSSSLISENNPTAQQEEHALTFSDIGHTKKSHKQDAKSKFDSFLRTASPLQFERHTEPQLTVVVVLFNQAELTYLCLESLLATDNVDFQLLIIDNNSTDETSDLLSLVDGADIIRSTENLGFLRAVNMGLSHVTSPNILLLNNDTILEPEAIGFALERLESAPDVGAVGAKIKLLDGTLQEAGSIIWSDGSCAGYGRGDSPDAPQYQFMRSVDYCSGAFLMLRTQDFLDLGGFDEQYAPAYYEESDLCVRLIEKGFRIIYEPKAEILHYEFASSDGYEGASKLQQRNQKLFIQKHQRFLSTKRRSNARDLIFARTQNEFPNLLILDDRVPYSSLGSGFPRCSDMLQVFSELKLNITYFPMNFPSDDWKKIYRNFPDTIEFMLDTGVEGLPHFLSQRKGFYDCILISRDHNMSAFNKIASNSPELFENVKIVYDAEAVTSPREIMRRRLAGEAISETEESAAINAELSEAMGTSSVIAVSQREADYFQNAGHKNVHVVGHQATIYSDQPTLSERNGLLFVGALQDEGSPNVDSLHWFISFVLPVIRQKIDDITLTVVGDSSAPSLMSIEDEHIEFTGRVESIDHYFDAARVFIAPTRFAAGIPHKIHEAAARGIPCVSTQLLATQLGWSNEEQLLVGDSPQAFAEQCLRLLEKSDLWHKIQKNAISAVSNDCSESTFREGLINALDYDSMRSD